VGFVNFPSPTPIFPVLPPLAWSVHKKPIMASRVTTAVSGRDNQLACAVYPRWEFTLIYSGSSWLRDETQNSELYDPLAGFTEFQQLSGLFLQCLGKYGEFYYLDPDDNSRAGQVVGQTNGTTSLFQLYYTWGSGPFIPPFTAPVTGIKTLKAVYFNNEVISPSLYEMDPTNTKIQFFSPPGGGATITADFIFYYRCSFSDDQLDFSQWEKNLWENKETRFESVKQ
jgi:uncharacterized protein (TIGR02217 family)